MASDTKPLARSTTRETPDSEELSGAKLKTDRDTGPDEQDKAVSLKGPGGTKVTAPANTVDSLKAAGFKG